MEQGSLVTGLAAAPAYPGGCIALASCDVDPGIVLDCQNRMKGTPTISRVVAVIQRSMVVRHDS